jgi:predicted RecB family nuclease
MRLTASDLYSYYRPSQCDLRPFLHARGEHEAPPSPYEIILRRLGKRHEEAHLATLGSYVNLDKIPLDERVERTKQEISKGSPVIYQPALRAAASFGTSEVEIVGVPDFLIRADDGRYVVRDSKISRRINNDDHPEILRQLELYGWLFEKTFGAPARALQVHSATGAIESVAFDGGIEVFAVLGRIIALKTSSSEPYSPVGWSKCGNCGLFDRCWPLATSRHDLALLADVDQNLAIALHGAGIDTLENLIGHFDEVSLAAFKKPWGKKVQKVGDSRASTILQSARVMISKQEVVMQTPAIPIHPSYAMFDVEGLPPHLDELEKIYLWGLQVYGEKPSEYFPVTGGFGVDGDRAGWESFLARAEAIFESYGDIRFVHWGSYEKGKIQLYTKRFGDPAGVAARVLKNLLDLLTITKQSMVLPLPSYGLKVVEEYIQFERSQEDYGGAWSMAKYIEATETENSEERNSVMQEILTYNREDLAATWAVMEWLRSKKVLMAA